MKLLSLKKVHMIGIKGQGMTALAEILLKNGVSVTGSDTDEIFTTDAILRANGIVVIEHFDPKNIPDGAETIIYSTAYVAEKNSELQAAFASGIPTLSYPEALGLLSADRLTIAICGTHGKTTTTALAGELLRQGKLDPTVVVGSQIHAWGGNALIGQGPHLVLEADEYQNKFQYYNPWGMILTSVDWDHPDFFSRPYEYEDAFTTFIGKIPHHGFLIACGDSAAVKRVAASSKGEVMFYGFHPDNDYRIVEYAPIPPDVEAGKSGFLQSFSIIQKNGSSLGSYRLRLSGEHNAQNAAAVVALAIHLKLPLETIQSTLESFSGTKRRFERIGEREGVLVYDDYAHHPDEVRATLKAFRELYPSRKISVIFHPHTFTRTKALFEDFAQCFEDAERVYLLDIYGSAREEQGGVSSTDLAARINRYTPGKAEYVPDGEALASDLRSTSRPGDIIVTMGAGDVWRFAESLIRP